MLGHYRFLAASGVVLAHASGGTDGMSRTMVSAFFIVSGYLMALTLDKNYSVNPLPFYWNRFLRLYPMHTLIALSVFIMAPWFVTARMGSLLADQYFWKFLETLTLTFSYHQIAGPSEGMLVGPAWTLPYELLFYLLAPLIFGFHWKRIPLGLIVFSAIGIGYLISNANLSLILKPFALGYNNPIAIYASFVMFSLGGFLYHLRSIVKNESHRHLFENAGIYSLALIIVLGSRYIAPDGAAFDSRYGIFLAVGAYISTSLILLGWSQRETKFSSLTGDLTYPVYLIHWPILHTGLFNQPFMREITSFFGHLFHLGHIISTAALALGVSIILSYLALKLEGKFIRPLRAPIRRQEK